MVVNTDTCWGYQQNTLRPSLRSPAVVGLWLHLLAHNAVSDLAAQLPQLLKEIIYKETSPALVNLCSSAQVLLLGCGDIRNILWTAQDKCPRANFHINDKSPAILARDLVLLSIVEALDPNKPDDFAFLWNVWYNVFWDENTADRFAKCVKSLLDSEVLDKHTSTRCKRGLVRPGDPELASQLKDILQWWKRATRTGDVLVDAVRSTR